MNLISKLEMSLKKESERQSLIKTLMTTSFVMTALIAAPVFAANANTMGTAEAEQKVNLEAAKSSQKKVDEIHEETQTLKGQYRQALQSIENTQIYNEQLREVIASQKEEKVRINEEIINVQETTQKVAPLMVKMKDSLADFVEADLPFLPKERKKRIKELDDLFVKSGVSLSEKYRKVLEAYLVENEYGSTIETYTDSLKLDGQEQSVEFLKVGRVGLYYLTKDHNKAGVWDLSSNKWKELSGSERGYVEKAIKVANKQSSPSLLTLPIIKSSAAGVN